MCPLSNHLFLHRYPVLPLSSSTNTAFIVSMFPSALQRESSAAHRLSYPRLVHCDVTFQPGPKPVPIPRLPATALVTSQPPALDWSIEQQVIDEVRQRKQREDDAAQQRHSRIQAEQRRRRELEEAEQRQRAEAAAEKRRREDEERKEAEGNRKRHEVEQEKLRHIAEAYKKQRAAVEAFSNKPHAAPSSFLSSSTSSSLSSSAMPVAPPVNRASRPSVTHPLLSAGQSSAGVAAASGARAASAAAVSSFQSITGVSDGTNAALLLSLLDSDVDYAVNVYFSDPGQADIHAAIDKAITIQERKQQQQQQQMQQPIR